MAQAFFGVSLGYTSVTGRADHGVRELEDEQERRDELKVAMDQIVVPNCECLIHGVFVVQLPLDDYRGIDDHLPWRYLRLPS